MGSKQRQSRPGSIHLLWHNNKKSANPLPRSSHLLQVVYLGREGLCQHPEDLPGLLYTERGHRVLRRRSAVRLCCTARLLEGSLHDAVAGWGREGGV